MNVKEENISSILESLPALKKPTISNLSESGWFSVSTIIDKSEFIKNPSTIAEESSRSCSK